MLELIGFAVVLDWLFSMGIIGWIFAIFFGGLAITAAGYIAYLLLLLIGTVFGPPLRLLDIVLAWLLEPVRVALGFIIKWGFVILTVPLALIGNAADAIAGKRRQRHPTTGMTPSQRYQWANRRGPYHDA